MVQASAKVRNRIAALYQFELAAHYGLIKNLDQVDLVRAVVKNCGSEAGSVEYAKNFWHGIFRDFKELRQLFPGHAERFGPYEGS